MKCKICEREARDGEFFWSVAAKNSPTGRFLEGCVCANCVWKLTGKNPVGLHELNEQRKKK